MKTPTLVAVLLLAAVPQERQSQLPASIEGVVVRVGTAEPIQGATVELTVIAPRTVEGSTRTSGATISVSVLETGTDDRVLSFTATTDRSGRFMFRNLPPTTGYQLIAIRQPDYLPAQYGQRIPSVPGQPIALADGEQLKDIRIEMTPSATISGSVVDALGQAVPKMMVELRRPWYLEGWRLISDWQETIQRVRGVGKTNRAGVAMTDNRGEFHFDGLAPAHYYVRTVATSDADAILINLHAGTNIQDVKLLAPQLQPRRVQGVVVRSGTGAMVDAATIAVVKRDAIPLYQNLGSSIPVRGGVFQMAVRQPGDYFVIATQRVGQSLLYGRKAIHVGDFEVDTARVEIAPTFEIAGNVTTEGNGLAAAASISLNLYPLLPGTPSIEPVALSIPRGTFTVRGVTPGDFRVEVSPILNVPPSSLVPPGLQNAYVKSIRLGRTDVLNGGLHLDAGVDALLEVVLSTRGGTLEGRVVDQDRKPTVNARVVLVPDAARRSRGDLYRSVSADDSGRYVLRGLPPGDYKLFAWERVEDGAWQDPEFLKLYENRGVSVRITEDGRQSKDATLIPAWN